MIRQIASKQTPDGLCCFAVKVVPPHIAHSQFSDNCFQNCCPSSDQYRCNRPTTSQRSRTAHRQARPSSRCLSLSRMRSAMRCSKPRDPGR